MQRRIIRQLPPIMVVLTMLFSALLYVEARSGQAFAQQPPSASSHLPGSESASAWSPEPADDSRQVVRIRPKQEFTSGDLELMNELKLLILTGQYEKEEALDFLRLWHKCISCSREHFLAEQQPLWRALLTLVEDEAVPYFLVHFPNGRSELDPDYQEPLDAWLLQQAAGGAEAFLFIGSCSKTHNRFFRHAEFNRRVQEYRPAIVKELNRSGMKFEEATEVEIEVALAKVLDDELANDRVASVEAYAKAMFDANPETYTQSWASSRYMDTRILGNKLRTIAARSPLFSHHGDPGAPYRLVVVFPIWL